MINFDYYYDTPDDSAFCDLCVLIGTHWFKQDEEFINHDNDAIERIANMIIEDDELLESVKKHFDKLEKDGFKID